MAREQVCTCQKFLVRADRATDVNRGAASVAPCLGASLCSERQWQRRILAWHHSTPSDLFLRSTSMDRLAAMEAFVLVVDTGSFSAAGGRPPMGETGGAGVVAGIGGGAGRQKGEGHHRRIATNASGLLFL